MNEAFKKIMRENAAKGGASRSPAKIKASQANAAKARQTLADRSAYVASKEAQGKARLVSDEPNASMTFHETRFGPDTDGEVTETVIEYDRKQKWTPTPDEIP